MLSSGKTISRCHGGGKEHLRLKSASEEDEGNLRLKSASSEDEGDAHP